MVTSQWASVTLMGNPVSNTLTRSELALQKGK